MGQPSRFRVGAASLMRAMGVCDGRKELEMDLLLPDGGGNEYTLPRVEAMLAGTLALMTGHAQNSCPNRRMLMALKIRKNLQELQEQAGLSEAFRTVVQRLGQHWGALAAQGPAAGDACGPAVEPAVAQAGGLAASLVLH